MEAIDSEQSSSQAPTRSIFPDDVPIITITAQDSVPTPEDGIELEEIPSFKAQQCCTLFLWTGKHQKCCKNNPKNRRRTKNISMLWIYFVLLMLFLCLFFVIFLSVIKGF